MTAEEFIELANRQSVVTVARVVSEHGLELKALLAARTPMRLSEIAAHPDQTREIRQFRYKHILGPGVARSEVNGWSTNHSGHPLPNDLVALVERVDGIHLWADLTDQQAYFGILPIRLWRDAAEAEWAMLFESPPRGLLVLSYHQNGDFFLILDTKQGEYLWYDLEDFDKPQVVAHNVPELLDWYWSEAHELDPRRGNS